MGRCPGAVTAAKGVIYHGGIYSIGPLRLAISAELSFFFPSVRCNYGAIPSLLGNISFKKKTRKCRRECSTDSSDDT